MKKPLWKSWWVLVAVIIVIAVGCGRDEEAVTTEPVKTEAPTEQPKEPENTVEAQKTPEETARVVIHKAFGETNSYNNNDSILDMTFNQQNGSLFVKVYARDNLSEAMIKKGMWMYSANALKDLGNIPEIKTVSFGIVYPLVDKSGQESNDIVMKMTFDEATRSNINWDNFLWKNMPDIAQDYWEHPVIRNIDTN